MPESTKELSGRELDAAVAEKIFSMIWCRLNRRDTSVILRQAEDAGNYWAARESDERIIESANNYSESIEAAMQVVEKMRETGHGILIGDEGGSGTWDVDFFGPDRTGNAESASLPEAICAAALAAIGSKESE